MAHVLLCVATALLFSTSASASPTAIAIYVDGPAFVGMPIAPIPNHIR